MEVSAFLPSELICILKSAFPTFFYSFLIPTCPVEILVRVIMLGTGRNTALAASAQLFELAVQHDNSGLKREVPLLMQFLELCPQAHG